jgi:hypothetical protein
MKDFCDILTHKNGPGFCRCWRLKFAVGNKCDEVDGCIDEKAIVDRLANHFSNSYTCSSVLGLYRLGIMKIKHNIRVSYLLTLELPGEGGYNHLSFTNARFFPGGFFQ